MPVDHGYRFLGQTRDGLFSQQLHQQLRHLGYLYPPSNSVWTGHELAVFLIFQEALTNVLDHAKASRVTVRARQQPDALTAQHA